MRSVWKALFGIGVCALCDQAVKYWVCTYLIRPWRLTPSLILIHLRNKGIGFSLLPAQSFLGVMFLVCASGVILIFLWSLYRKTTSVIMSWGLILIMGGAVGNMLDRIFRGSVVDFILCHWGEWVFPAFNLADSLITVGVVCILSQISGDSKDNI